MIGQTISHYRIIEKLGEGGMGIVYKAQDIRLDRFVALKFLPSTPALSPDEIARFEQEAKVISGLNHPNIATLYDADEADGRKFLVLEYISGGTLTSKLRSLRGEGKELPIPDVINYGIQIAEGLASAHREGIIHRDVKTDNIMLTKEGYAKITDFGIAKLGGAEQLTRTGTTVGTAAYMSPEQIRGESVDGRSDLFSLGIVLYELATMQKPFRGEHEAALAYSIVHEEPQPAKVFRQDIPDSLALVIAKCLEKDPSMRYQTGDEVARDLRIQHVDNVNTRVAVAATQRSWLPRAIGAALVVLAVFGIYLFKPGLPSTPESHKSIAVLPFVDMSPAQDQEYFSDGLAEELLNRLAKIANLKVAARTSSFFFKGKNAKVSDIGKDLGVSTILEGSVRTEGNTVRITAELINVADGFQMWSETYDRKLDDIFAVQDDIARSVAGALKVALLGENTTGANAQGVNVEAYNAYLQGSYFLDRREKEDLEKAVSYFERALQIDSGYACAWIGLSAVHNAQADFGYMPVEKGYALARKEANKGLELAPNLAAAHARLGWILTFHDWDWAGADAAYKRALALEPANARVIVGAASLAATLGRFDEAIQLDRKAIALDPLRAAAHFNLGFHAYYAGRWEEADAAFRKVLELNPGHSTAHMRLGQIFLVQSKPEEALVEMKKEPEPVDLCEGLALGNYAAGRGKEADSSLAQFIVRYHDDSAFQIAEIYSYRNEVDSAFAWLERAYKQRDGGLTEIKGDPLFRNIEKDRRYGEFMKKMKLPL